MGPLCPARPTRAGCLPEPWRDFLAECANLWLSWLDWLHGIILVKFCRELKSLKLECLQPVLAGCAGENLEGYVDNTPYDTTSIIKLVTRRFDLEPLPGVRANAGDLTGALDLSR